MGPWGSPICACPTPPEVEVQSTPRVSGTLGQLMQCGAVVEVMALGEASVEGQILRQQLHLYPASAVDQQGSPAWAPQTCFRFHFC